MSQDVFDEFDEVFDDDFDPLADAVVDGDDVDFPVGTGENIAAPGADCHVRPVPEHDERPAEVRTAELFEAMPGRRKTLRAILAHCVEPCPVREVEDYIAELKRLDRSVYTANDLMALLVRAGAVERVGADGGLYREEHLEPRTVVVDGVEYLEAQTPAPAFWRTTPAAVRLLADDNPQARVEALFEEEGVYLPIFKRILTLASGRDGVSAAAIAKAVDGDPLLQSPRYYASRFVEKLNLADALGWQGKTWAITQVGRDALASLDSVEDPASDVIAADLEA